MHNFTGMELLLHRLWPPSICIATDEVVMHGSPGKVVPALFDSLVLAKFYPLPLDSMYVAGICKGVNVQTFDGVQLK